MYIPLRALALLASALVRIAADDPDVPEFQCSSDAILVCCEEYVSVAIGLYVGNASECTSPCAVHERQPCANARQARFPP